MSDVAPIANAGMEVSSRRSSRYPTYVFWIMFLISFLNYLDRNVLSGAANVVAHELGIGPDGIGYIASAFLVVYTLSTVPLGIWADRTKRKNVVAVSVTAWSLITAFTALAVNFGTLFVSRMALGIGEGGYFPAGTALMSDYYSRSKRSRIMSWWSVGQLVGILVGFIIGGELAGLFPGSWRLAFVFTGIPGLILAFLAWRLREPRRNEADEEELAQLDRLLPVEQALEPVEEVLEREQTAHAVVITPDVFKQFGSLLRIKTLVVLIVMQVFAFFVLGVNIVFLPTYLQQKDIFKFSSGQAGLFSGVVIVVGGMVGTVLGGYMADVLNRRFPGARILVCGIGFLLGAPAFAIAMLVHSLGIFTIFFTITAILLTVYTGPSTAATQDVVPSALRASSVAITLLIAHLLGDAFSPSIVGILVKAIDPTHGLHFQQGMAGQDFSIALFVTCTPALLIAGLVGVLGSGWMKGDIAAAELADKQVREQRAS